LRPEPAWISGILNVAVPAARRMRDAVLAGDLVTARGVWARELLPIRFIYTKNQLGPINDLELYRSILRLRGIDPGFSRRPLLPLTAEQNARLAELLTEHDLI
jgi:dihydrodipicolinate synthase/N-acetylneuraminate lyase